MKLIVFIKTQSFKAKLDIYRTTTALGDVAIQVQKIARGNIIRQKYSHLLKKNVGRADIKKQEATERVLMGQEDLYSQEMEKEFEADVELQASIKKMRDANRAARLEKERKEQLSGSVLIQKLFRGVRGRMFGRIYMLETTLEQAIRSRHEDRMEHGIRMTTGFFYALTHLQYRPKKRPVKSVRKSTPKKYIPYTWGYSVRLLKAYHHNAKEVLLEVQAESYVNDQLRTAINTQSIDILKEAVQSAETLKME